MKKSTKRILVRRIASAVMSAILIVGTVVCAFPEMALTAHAAGTGKNLQLVTGNSAPNISGVHANSVYFGTYNQSGTGADPIKWRVLQNSGSQLFLLADKKLDCKKYNDSYTPATWETCTLRDWLNGTGAYTNDNFISVAFSSQEISSIADSSVVNSYNPVYNTPGGNNTTDKLFLLSIDEVRNTAYGFTDDDSRIAANTTYATNQGCVNGIWCLRSTGQVGSDVAFVSAEGSVIDYGHYVDRTFGVRPAFNLNLSSIIFTSAAVGGKSSGNVGAGALTEVENYSGNDWKVTLLDDGSTNSVGSGHANFSATLESNGKVNAGDNISISYEDATVGANEYVSAILLNSSGELLCYGRIADKSSGSADGTADITIPAGLAGGTYTVKVFSEQYNGDKLTDYVSAFSSIFITVESSGGSNTSVPTVVRTSEPEPPINWMQEVEDKISAAIALGGPQTVYIKGYDTLSYHVLEMLKEHSQITLVSEFTYDGLDYRITIPGSVVKLDPSINWYGPKYLFPMFYMYGTDTLPAVQAYLEKYES